MMRLSSRHTHLGVGSWPIIFGIDHIIVVSYFLLFLSFNTILVLAKNDSTDRLALLDFKAKIINDNNYKGDPRGVFSSWNSSLHFCQWRGVTCSPRHQRVTVLDLQSSQLKGQLSPHVGNLSFLRVLNLRNNSFSHVIPPQIGRLFRLRVLDLENNSFTGVIPVNMSRCSNLQYISLRGSNLTGRIPKEIGSLSKLEVLYLHRNSLVGEIPASVANISSLKMLNVRENNLHGGIPTSLGELRSLVQLSIGGNHLTGVIPPSIYNISSLKIFSVLFNQFHGSLPPQLGNTLPNLEFFSVYGNNFSGRVPESISNASNLSIFEISDNNFEGKMPSLAGLSLNLRSFGIGMNNLGHGENDDLDFLSSLINCTELESIGINGNSFGGKLPEFIGNFSTKLFFMQFGNNQIRGSIPVGITNLVNMERLFLWGNQLTGPIPSSIGKLQKLYHLDLSDNKLSGLIPSSLGNSTSLGQLILSSNNLQGSIPSILGECKNLFSLDLATNNLSGPIPKEVMSLSSFQVLDLSGNHLSGTIPEEVGNLVNLVFLDVYGNELSGGIPETLGSCLNLELLNLGENSLQGTIPQTLASLRGVKRISFAGNRLSGNIPVFLERLQNLQRLNLSFNDFEGEVPIRGIFENISAFSITGNTRLCGGLPQLKLPKCNSNSRKKSKLSPKLKQVMISISCGLVALVLMLMFVITFCRSRKRGQSILGSSFRNRFLRVSYADLLNATNGFSSENLIGVGSFGSVYKGIINQDEEKVVAVKVLSLQTSRAPKSFVAECKALKGVRHRNLVKLLTACASVDFQGNDFKALVYEFMVNGSLEEWLHHDRDQRHLNLIQRVDIAIDVANALDYLHNHSHMKIVHCDLKPTNVLLDNDMIARVGDFGLARFLPNTSHPFSSDQTSSTIGIRGSIGYVAPEYGMGSEVSTFGDVYSYGILLLEMFTRKRPTDGMFKDDLNLHNFASMALTERVEEIIDPLLVEKEESRGTKATNSNGDEIRKCLVSIIQIGVACSLEIPGERMNISNVVVDLCHVRDVLNKTRGDKEH